MKTKQQKQESLAKGSELLGKSEAVVLFDFSNVKTTDLRVLRQELKKAGNPLYIIKKRLLAIALKERGVRFDAASVKTSVGAVFASSLEEASASVYRFFKGLDKQKKAEGPRILGGADLRGKTFLPAADVTAIGALPPRDELLALLAAAIAAPVRALLYILKDRSQRST